MNTKQRNEEIFEGLMRSLGEGERNRIRLCHAGEVCKYVLFRVVIFKNGKYSIDLKFSNNADNAIFLSDRVYTISMTVSDAVELLNKYPLNNS